MAASQVREKSVGDEAFRLDRGTLIHAGGSLPGPGSELGCRGSGRHGEGKVEGQDNCPVPRKNADGVSADDPRLPRTPGARRRTFNGSPTSRGTGYRDRSCGATRSPDHGWSATGRKRNPRKGSTRARASDPGQGLLPLAGFCYDLKSGKEFMEARGPRRRSPRSRATQE